MKAAVCARYGPPGAVVQIVDVEKPVPKDNEVLMASRGVKCRVIYLVIWLSR